MIKICDRALVKKIAGFRWISELISGGTFSKFSHGEPILNAQGDSIDATIPKIKRSNISKYFDGKHRVRILRPLKALNQFELEGWYVNCIKKEGKWYNLFKRNCAGTIYDADKAIGLLNVTQKVVTPQMYNLLAEAGCLFEVVYDAYKPDMNDFKKLMEG